MHGLRMGRIGYLNVLPIYYPLEAGILQHNFEIVSGPPALLNSMMAQGDLHVSSASCFEYACHPEQYYLIDDLSIGSRGPVMSVLLLSACPVEELQGKDVLVTTETATSLALLRILLAQKYGIDVTYTVGNVSHSLHTATPPTAFLAIGDEALRLRNHVNYPYCIDLAEAWRQWTDLPFIFGVWVVSRKAADAQIFSQDPGKLLRAARQWSLEHMDVILDLTYHGCPLSRQELATYYTDGLLYTLQGEELRGLELFFNKLVDAGMIDKVPPLHFYESMNVI